MTSFESFRQTFKGDIVDPSSPDYEQAITRWALNAVRRSRYVFFPKDTKDVTEAIKYVVENNISFAVKGGGHNPSGASSVEDGICIDMSKYFDYANVDPEAKTVDVGGGALWKTVDNAAIVHNLALPGGTVSLTGVAGLTTGGGHGFLSGRHGLTIDSVLEMEVVLADGSVVKTSKDSYPDLFWALRGGGGGNYGVVTNFKFQLHPQRPTVYGGFLVYPSTKLEEVIKVFDEWIPTITEDEFIGLGMSRLPDQTPACMIVVFYNGSPEEGRRRYKAFFDLEPIFDMTQELPYPRMNELVNENAAKSRRYYMTGTSLRSDVAAHGKQIFERFVALSEKHPKDETLPPYEVHVMYEVFSRKKLMSLSPDATAFRGRGTYHNVLISVVWDKEAPGDTEIARSISKELTSIIESTAVKELKEFDNNGYGNYLTDPADVKTRSQRLWGENLPRLQQIKKTYDPKNVFNKWIPIKPAES